MTKKLLFIVVYLLMVSTYCVANNGLLSDSTSVFFDFKQKDNTFFASYKNNASGIKILYEAIEKLKQNNANPVASILVSSYCAAHNTELDNYEAAKIRANHVKSDMILNCNITDGAFVTHTYTTDYRNGRVGVLVKLGTGHNQEPLAITSSPQREKESPNTATVPKAKKHVEDVVTPEDVVTKEQWLTDFSIRTNILHWAILTPNVGAELRVKDKIGILFSAAWADWSWSDGDRKYHVWKVNPEVRYYLGNAERFYLGAEFHTGKFNIRRSDTGRTGNYIGGGISTGYVWQLNKALSFDFNLGLGGTHLKYDKSLLGLYQTSKSKNIWGMSQAGIVLAWKLH